MYTNNYTIPRSQACINEPACIVQPRDENDISTAIRIIGFFRAKFSVRSGGHSPNPGWSSVGQDGVLLSLEKINTAELSEDQTYATIGPGARWGAVYDALDSHKAVVSGARLPDVGVGVFFLGGNYMTQNYKTR